LGFDFILRFESLWLRQPVVGKRSGCLDDRAFVQMQVELTTEHKRLSQKHPSRDDQPAAAAFFNLADGGVESIGVPSCAIANAAEISELIDSIGDLRQRGLHLRQLIDRLSGCGGIGSYTGRRQQKDVQNGRNEAKVEWSCHRTCTQLQYAARK